MGYSHQGQATEMLQRLKDEQLAHGSSQCEPNKWTDNAGVGSDEVDRPQEFGLSAVGGVDDGYVGQGQDGERGCK